MQTLTGARGDEPLNLNPLNNETLHDLGFMQISVLSCKNLSPLSIIIICFVLNEMAKTLFLLCVLVDKVTVFLYYNINIL